MSKSALYEDLVEVRRDVAEALEKTVEVEYKAGDGTKHVLTATVSGIDRVGPNTDRLDPDSAWTVDTYDLAPIIDTDGAFFWNGLRHSVIRVSGLLRDVDGSRYGYRAVTS